MGLIITKGESKDLAEVAALYTAVHLDLEIHTNYPGWHRTLYPTQQTAEEALLADSLYLAREGNVLTGTVILNREQPESFAQLAWPIVIANDSIVMIHTLAVHPHFQGAGIGRMLLQFAENWGRQQGAQALRLDVLEGNLPAIRLYERCGYIERGKVDLGLGALGLPWFHVYEKLL